MDRIRNSTRYKMEIPASAVGGFVKKAGKEVGKFGQAVNDKVIKPYIKPVSQEVAHVLSYGLKGASQYGKVVADTTAILDTISPEIKTISEKLKKDNKDGK